MRIGCSWRQLFFSLKLFLSRITLKMSPPDAAPPPAFTPPDAEYELVIPPAQIILTQATPEIEHPDSTQQKAPEDVGNYAPLVSSPDSPTKTVAAAVKDTTTESGIEEINSEITIPSQATEECPTVVMTTFTGSDTPTSDDDMELKEKEEPPKEKEAEPEAESKENTYKSADEFECTFPDMDSEVPSQKVPSSSETVVEFGQKSSTKEPESTFSVTENMEVNGDTSTDFFADSGNAETTG